MAVQQNYALEKEEEIRGKKLDNGRLAFGCVYRTCSRKLFGTVLLLDELLRFVLFLYVYKASLVIGEFML